MREKDRIHYTVLHFETFESCFGSVADSNLFLASILKMLLVFFYHSRRFLKTNFLLKFFLRFLALKPNFMNELSAHEKN